MAGNAVHAAKRLRVLFSADHKAGDLVYEKGFYGVVQDDVKAGKWGTLILGGAWNLPRVPATLAMGTKVYAGPSSVATSLVLIGGPTTGANQVGRAIATGNATTAKIQLFNPNDY